MTEEWIREDFFLKFDVNRTSLLPRCDISKHLPLYKKKGEDITDAFAPRLFTRDKLEKFGVLDDYELYITQTDEQST